MRSRHRGEVLVLQLTSEKPRLCNLIGFWTQADIQTDASHHTEVNDGEPVARTPLALVDLRGSCAPPGG